MSLSSDREKLKDILLRRSVRRGEFKLVSGRTSSVYVDGKLTTLAAEAMPVIGRLFLDKMDKNGWNARAIGGLTLGADPIVTAVARESLERGGAIDAFLVRKEAKKHGTQRFIEGIEETQDLPVVIVDDVCTTGGSTADAIGKAKEAGMRVLGAICLVDRETGAADLLKTQFACPFDRIFTLSELLEDESYAAKSTSSGSISGINQLTKA
jgi:orotate phosphoribosyltransferase